LAAKYTKCGTEERMIIAKHQHREDIARGGELASAKTLGVDGWGSRAMRHDTKEILHPPYWR